MKRCPWRTILPWQPQHVRPRFKDIKKKNNKMLNRSMFMLIFIKLSSDVCDKEGDSIVPIAMVVE